jgi:hypothetical protein
MQRYHSEIITLSAKKADDDRFTVVPIEAADAMSAAQRIAEIAARRRYSDDGSVGYVSPSATTAGIAPRLACNSAAMTGSRSRA